MLAKVMLNGCSVMNEPDFIPATGKQRKRIVGQPMGIIPSRNARKLPTKKSDAVVNDVDNAHLIGHNYDLNDNQDF